MSSRGLRLELARIVIEAKTPFLVGTGRGSDLRDEVFVTDANGLPTIPGTTIAGLLRHAIADRDASLADDLFGSQEASSGTASRVEVSFAQIHGASGRPVPFLGSEMGRDELLSFVAGGIVRDHVRIDSRGVADERGKFDELLVPVGARFTFELVIHGDGSPAASKLVGYLGSLRVGAHTRRGHGLFRIASLRSRRFNLEEEDDRKLWLTLPRDLSHPEPSGVLNPTKVDRSAPANILDLKLKLRPRGYWMFGGGAPMLEEHKKSKTEFHDRVPVTERRIVWNDQGQGSVSELVTHVVPGSAVKGALRHRVAFHVRREQRAWALAKVERADDRIDPQRPDALAEVVELFGTIKKSSEGADVGSPGRVYIDDGYLTQVVYGQLEHVSLDRLTQGPMAAMLFGEAPLHGGEIVLTASVDKREVSELAKKSLDLALQDLCEGRLAIGAGSNKGHGYVSGTIEWSDGGRWIGERK
ncbi:MAG: hypothetical protein HY791_29350 [Deltaproteobacteria bacterium]|nr:hypothetical protein [Deltaproteobacteria bacterium]